MVSTLIKIKYLIILSIICLIATAQLSGSVAAKSTSSLFVAHAGINESNRTYILDLLERLQKTKPDGHTIKQLNTKELTLAQIENEISVEKSCIISVGDFALKKILTTRQSAPIFSTQVSKTNLDSLINSYQRFGISLTGIYQEQPFLRQLFLSKAISADISSVGVFFGNKTRYSQPYYQSLAKKQAISLQYFILKHHVSAQNYLERLPINGGFLMILNDERHYSNNDLQSLLLASQRKRIPLIGSKLNDSKIAALASVYTPVEELAKQAAEKIGLICSGSNLPAPTFSNKFKVKVNDNIAKTLGYESLSEEVLARQISTQEQDITHE